MLKSPSPKGCKREDLPPFTSFPLKAPRALSKTLLVSCCPGARLLPHQISCPFSPPTRSPAPCTRSRAAIGASCCLVLY